MVTQARPTPALDGIERLVVVPSTPGPLTDIDRRRQLAGDEIDETLDDWFGDDVDEPVGWLDVALLGIGVAIVVWGLVSGWQGPLPWIGLGLTGLGLAFPIRELSSLAREERTARSVRRLLGDGYYLDAGHPVTADLLEAYATCLRVAGTSPGAAGAVVEAAHQAVVEVATLLGGRRPTLGAEVAYIRDRERAIRSMTLALRRRNRAVRASLDLADASRVMADAHRPRVRDELAAATGLGSLERMTATAAALVRETDDATR